MDFARWLKTWLARHPLKAPADADGSRFTPYHGGGPACEGGEERRGNPEGLSPKPRLSSRGTGFTAQVMARVRAETRPGRAPAAWTERLPDLWPRLAVSLAATAAVLAGVAVLRPLEPGQRLADRIAQESELLAELDGPVNGWGASDDVDSLAQDLEREDAIVLAEAPPDDDSWIADTLQLLDQLDEELPDEPSAGEATSNEDEWLDELQTLDENELAARS